MTLCLMTCACGDRTNAAAAEGASGGSGPVTVTVNPSNTRSISPYIYGLNFATKMEGAPAGLTLDRTGGNRWTAYNWETNASNAGSDYQYQNDAYLGDSKEPGAAVTSVIEVDRRQGMASLVTLQMQGWVAADTNGPVNAAKAPEKGRFKQVVPEKKTVSTEPLTAKPSQKDDFVFMDEFAWAIDQKFAGQNIFAAKPATQPVFVSLDNEPELWNKTHLEIQGAAAVKADAYIAKTITLATALRKQYPDMVLFGPAHYGFMGLYNWNNELKASANLSNWFADKYLSALKSASAASGRQLVDVYDLHWYPEAQDSSGARIVSLSGPTLTDDQVQAIVQSPRSLWDKTYKEKSWIVDVVGKPLELLPMLQAIIESDNPGMKLALTEYNNGGGQHIAGAIAQADNLGIFGAQGLFAATMWPLSPKEPYSMGGFRAFRNFDGADHHFGNTSVQASSSDPARVMVYVSTDTARPGRVVMVAINRSTTAQPTVISGQPLSGTAHLFQMTAATAGSQSTVRPVAAGTQAAAGSSLTLTLPALSVTTVDIY
jgi:hypothetical protein